MSNEIIEAGTTAIRVQQQSSATPGDLVRYALDNGADIEKLEKLMAMQIQWEEREAKKAFVAAMAEFKKNPPEIVKSKLVGYENKDGTYTGYKHATLGDVSKAVIESLARHGFSHRWDVSQPGDGRIVVKCIITHDAGHSEVNSMESGADNSGKKNSIQSIASAVTYLQRYTLLAAVGLSTVDQADDDDGAGTERDYTLQNLWVGKVYEAKSYEELKKIWKEGVKEFDSAQDVEGEKAFRAALSDKKRKLEAGNV